MQTFYDDGISSEPLPLVVQLLSRAIWIRASTHMMLLKVGASTGAESATVAFELATPGAQRRATFEPPVGILSDVLMVIHDP